MGGLGLELAPCAYRFHYRRSWARGWCASAHTCWALAIERQGLLNFCIVSGYRAVRAQETHATGTPHCALSSIGIHLVWQSMSLVSQFRRARRTTDEPRRCVAFAQSQTTVSKFARTLCRVFLQTMDVQWQNGKSFGGG